MIYLYVPLDGDSPAQSDVPPECHQEQFEAMVNDELDIYRVGPDGRFEQLIPIQVGDVDSWNEVEEVTGRIHTFALSPLNPTMTMGELAAKLGTDTEKLQKMLELGGTHILTR